MKRSTILLTGLAMVLYLGAISVSAQHGRGGGPPPGAGPGAGADRGPSATHGPSTTPGSESGSSKKTVSNLLTQNTKLASRIKTLTGMDAQKACSGFKNLGQCVAAAHVAHNLGGSCTFANLKGATTGSSAKSLGQAIHACNPDVDAKAEAKKANHEAKVDLEESEHKS